MSNELGQLTALIAEHGYLVVAAVVALESMGLPLPGETTLVTAAIYAGTSHRLNIVLVIAAAAAGAIVGDSLGFWIGRRFGHPLLVRYGRVLGLEPARIKLGQYLFARHGGKVVFFGRFVAVLRALAALLAGVNYMPWKRFLLFNATGGVVWATIFGSGGYFLGQQFNRVHGSLAAAGLTIGVMAFAAAWWFLRRHQASLQAEAERALPGPLADSRPGAD